MKKLSLRMRMTMIMSLWLVAFAVLMSIIFFWLADTQVVQYIEMDVVGTSQEGAVLENNSTTEYCNVDELPVDEAEELCDEALTEGLFKFRISGLIILVIVIILGVFISWIFSGWSIAPVKKLSRQVDAIDEQKLSTYIEDFSAGDELQNLAESFNAMLKRLDNAFEREKRFSAAAAHELKTPLTVMKASIDVLELSDNPTNEEYQETICHVKKQIAKLTALVTELLTYSRPENFLGQSKIRLDEIITNLIDELKVSYPDLVVEDEIDTCMVTGNSAIIERVIFNLLDNAAKYSPKEGKVSVKLSTENNNIVFCVKDQGIGISESSAERIFEPFYRDEQSRKRKIAGVGLGLAFVKEYADECGGTITYSNNVPCGSVFTLSIPQKTNSKYF